MGERPVVRSSHERFGWHIEQEAARQSRLQRIAVPFTFQKMARRSTQQSKLDDLAFPVRIKVAIPRHGLGPLLDRMHQWLNLELEPGEFSSGSSPGIGASTAAFHFRALEQARQFLTAFPEAELADGTLSPAFTSPTKRKV
ncbi:hypothetical protein [Aurantiacibacter flavus]|uniref:Uncharacterized protein n=1 Tax=Aurantiacibacter flavus TaxID=3145232 RepID=A0ABV0CVE5_9SPHN